MEQSPIAMRKRFLKISVMRIVSDRLFLPLVLHFDGRPGFVDENQYCWIFAIVLMIFPTAHLQELPVWRK